MNLFNYVHRHVSSLVNISTGLLSATTTALLASEESILTCLYGEEIIFSHLNKKSHRTAGTINDTACTRLIKASSLWTKTLISAYCVPRGNAENMNIFILFIQMENFLVRSVKKNHHNEPTAVC